jgi:hypothetical protein
LFHRREAMKSFYHHEKDSGRFLSEGTGRLTGLRKRLASLAEMSFHVRRAPLTPSCAAFNLSA